MQLMFDFLSVFCKGVMEGSVGEYFFSCSCLALRYLTLVVSEPWYSNHNIVVAQQWHIVSNGRDQTKYH
jgi:hypothetical protein